MFEKIKFQTGEKQLCPQTMQAVSRIKNLLNSAMLFACSFTYIPNASAENIVDGNEDVMQIYADIIDLQCQYDFAGNLNTNVINTGVRSEIIGNFQQLSIFHNKGDGFNFVDNNGNCYKTESLTDNTEVIFVDNQSCATTSFENLRFQSPNSGPIEIPNIGNQLLDQQFGANAIDNNDGFSQIRADRPLLNLFRPDINVSFSKRWFYTYAAPLGADIYSTDVFWVTDYTVLIPFDDVANYMENQETINLPTAIRIDYPLNSQADRMKSYRLLSPYFLVARNSNRTEIFAYDEMFKVWSTSSVLNRPLTQTLSYEQGKTYVADNRYAFKEYRISSIINNTASVDVLNCSLAGEAINRPYHVLSDLNEPYPDEEVVEIIDEVDMEVPQPQPLPPDQMLPDMELPEEDQMLPDMELPEEDQMLPDMELPEDDQMLPDMELLEEDQMLPDMELPEEDQMQHVIESTTDQEFDNVSDQSTQIEDEEVMHEQFSNTADNEPSSMSKSPENQGCNSNPHYPTSTSLWMASILLLGVRVRKKFSLQK